MTQRTYYNSDELTMRTLVLDCSPADDGKFRVTLAATLFHPQGASGHPCSRSTGMPPSGPPSSNPISSTRVEIAFKGHTSAEPKWANLHTSVLKDASRTLSDRSNI